MRSDERTGFLIPTFHHELHQLLPGKRILVSHDGERGEPPVDAVQAEVGRHVVGQVVFMLSIAHVNSLGD